jgi:AraC-like DNA-binding protein
MEQGQSASENAPSNYRVDSRFLSPPEEFDGCFTTFYQLLLEVDDGGTVVDYLQPEWGNIRFFAGSTPISGHVGGPTISHARYTATGPSSLPVRFEIGTCKMWGVGFLPLGWARLVDADASELANLVCAGADHPVFRKFDTLSEVLCDASVSDEQQYDAIADFMRQHAREHRDEDKIIRVHRALIAEDLSTVAEFADASGMSLRTLERVCHRFFGFTPKLLMRRQRFIRSLSTYMLHQGSKWTEAMDAHYHDQAQFTREFHEFMTMNPSEYAALDHPILQSFMKARAQARGSAAQALDSPGR